MEPQNTDPNKTGPLNQQPVNADISPPPNPSPASPVATPVIGGLGTTTGNQPAPIIGSDIRPVTMETASQPVNTASYSPPSTASAGLAPPVSDEYISNPFLNTVRGLVLILKANPTSAMLSGLIGLLLIGAGELIYFVTIVALKSPALAVIFFIALTLLYIIPIGTYYVIAGTSARGETITTGEAYRRSISKLLPLIGLCFISGILTLVGFVLLIIPGIIFMSRNSLSPLVMFEEDLGPIAAIKRSLSLTKGHVNEMLGALFASLFIGGGGYGLLFGAITVAPLVGRYHDLRQLKESGAAKPSTHWLNYTYLLVILLFAGGIGLAIFSAHNLTANLSQPTTSQTQNSFSSYPTTSTN